MIYLDHAATTPIRGEVMEAMVPFLTEEYGNASSIYGLGRGARSAVDKARHSVAQFFGCADSEIVFTSGGTESIHSALLGAWLARPDRKHIITTAVEHHAVLHTCDLLHEMGLEVTILDVDENGRVSVEDVIGAIRGDTLCVSVMMVNNELGSVNQVAAIAEAVHRASPDVLVHSDMVQAAGVFRLELDRSGVDLASMTAHKLGGPKGIGALYIRRGTQWKSVLRGGAQERERRAGTENTAAIVGFGAAVDWLSRHFEEHTEAIRVRSQALREGLSKISAITWNSPPDGVPHILNVRFHGIRADRLLMRLDLEGVAASAGSACAAGSLTPSHVLLAIGLDPKAARESVRFSLSDEMTEEEISQALEIIERTVSQLQSTTRPS
ncbi:cysteine desulfurase family protein [Alicyclobacillus ferrooxydans]|uniref:cysteine desulfurase n=1 Tax=Alicyclobacillus ferrooxydans TaxID=471514 RepID=A0A0P9CMS0_9BACL|nr:cysteine desulfurase family protein [Alicyclobacillus ferrooxydans]KPV44215.1 hypothetical protein AN477_07880 [Alicyclobacillus ferrooxydans]